MIDFLAANPDKAAAWAGVQGMPASDVGRYINSLTSVVLRSDTRVTNHGFRDGRANPLQSILQAGTAVLVDEYGVPRARCACGNPLVPPKAVPVTPSYQGQPWPGFTPTNVTVVNQSTSVINVIIVIDIDNGDPYGIPTNPGGATATVTSTPAQTFTPPQTVTGTATPRPTQTAATSGQGSPNWRFKSATFIPLLGQPNYQVTTPWTTTGGGITLTVSDTGTHCTGGGTETVRLSWTFERDIASLANGDTFVATASAAKAGVTGGCGSGIAALTGLNVSTIAGDGSMPLTAFTRPPDRERILGRTNDASADNYQGRQPSESATLTVSSRPSEAGEPEMGFHVAFFGPGLQFYVLYIYEQV